MTMLDPRRKVFKSYKAFWKIEMPPLLSYSSVAALSHYNPSWTIGPDPPDHHFQFYDEMKHQIKESVKRWDVPSTWESTLVKKTEVSSSYQ